MWWVYCEAFCDLEVSVTILTKCYQNYKVESDYQGYLVKEMSFQKVISNFIF